MPSIDLSSIPIPPPTTLLELRMSKLEKFGTVLSGIDEKPIHIPLYVSATGLTDDEHDLTFHAAKFVAGGFGEKFVAQRFTEENLCIGNLVRVGSRDSASNDDGTGCLLEVSLSRQPCFKLNQRFGIKTFAPQTHQEDKTGWDYRVIKQGYIFAGMELRVVERPNPTWSIARLQHFFHRDKSDLNIAMELSELSELGDECKDVFKKRIRGVETKAAKPVAQWVEYTVTFKTLETQLDV
ncbi:PK beta-barrel-protein domain-containing protein-like protein [Aureobasidium namibiae CBS 147.97]|uniref:PK beta-barrel-protein domain-containing protein-like protein n=1 Tax=Aureobasidium namibiae CBS 147.97 TaxID=1043004 RepID=A0A074XHV1_9PEZI